MITISNNVTKKLITLLLLLVLLSICKVFLMPLAIGGILATLFLPLCTWLERRKIYKGIASLICLLLILIFIASSLSILVWEISELTTEFDLIKQKSIENIDKLQEYVFKYMEISLEKQSQILHDEQPSISKIIQNMGGVFSYLITNFILVMAYVFLLLYYRNHIKLFILKLIKQTDSKKMLEIVYSVTRVSQQYLLGLFKIIICRPPGD